MWLDGCAGCGMADQAGIVLVVDDGDAWLLYRLETNGIVDEDDRPVVFLLLRST